ncbi:tudor domain-containing protein 7-like [Odontomachus brunneus]|uniref:tudor domain-containing protein 7-like n=1 Tax=Odontomachus brunneus TaxID=486640 RepID=UPI0013F20D19|nr:tudor domain-containing protein 7-like [Odontomachus brunneus]XP_032664576.1 tudor domain-containing protein 7-like [Odontomachus brunneus]
MDQNEIVKILRSCLISCKGGVKLDNLKADYRMITGESLPYRNFGFPSIEAFIRNIPDISVTNRNGELYVDALPSRTTAHLTKLISHQVSRRKTRHRPQAKKWSPHRYTSRGYLPGFKNNGSQPTRYNNQNSLHSFTKSTPGRNNLYTDFNRPPPLMENLVQCPFPINRNNEKPRFAMDIPQISPSKRLKDKVANPSISTSNLNQSSNKSKIDGRLGNEVLFERAVPPPVISSTPKTVEEKPSKLSDRLKISTPLSTDNNGHIDTHITRYVPQVAPVDDPRKELIVRTNALDLSLPIYKTYTKKERSNPTKITIYASVKVGTHTFHTYPEDARSEEEAEKIAARLALMNLAKEESSSPEVTTIDVNLVKERILKIITRHPSGVFMPRIPFYYKESYDEALPLDWQKIIAECADINQEKGVGNSTILCRSDPTAKRPEIYSPSHDMHSDMHSSLSTEKIQLNPIGPAAPDKLKIPEATLWNVYPTCVISTIEVWVRLVDDDYNDNFTDMMNNMTEHYNKIKQPASTSTCVRGDFYAILEDDYWHRVQCIDYEPDTRLATVHFIDDGYEDQYKCDVLQPLEKKFCLLPAQAVRVALQGLEELRDCGQTITEIENQLLERVFCVKVHSLATDEDGSYASVTFYDTSSEDDINMNDILFEKIMENITAGSKLNAGQFVELYVTNMDVHGKVYAQLNFVSRTCLLNLMNDEIMTQIPLSVRLCSAVRAIDFTKMYLVQLDSQWYRARVTDVQNERLVKVFLIDVGRTVTALRKNLLHIDKISKVLQSILPQATQIFLHGIDQSIYGEKFVTKFNELVSDTDLLIAKVVRITISGVPVVQIFKRVQPSNMLASINESLIHDLELIKSNEDGNNNNNIKPKKRLERKNSRILESGKLNPPMISDIGQFFDVHVTLAAHPGHFIVQPLNNGDEMKAMMTELQKYCDAYEGPELESVGEGKLYAGKFMDNYWYRVYVTNIINENTISVYFCDFGDVTIVPRNRLQPLKSEFLELPYQAVKAKLVGIQPMNIDWTVEDCVRFRDLVLGKNFVSIVVESMFDHLSPVNDTVLGLKLIDVNTDQDIFIDKLLVEENRAKFIEGENLPLS